MDLNVFCRVDYFKIRFEKRLAKKFNNTNYRVVLELVYKHLHYYEEIARRSIDSDINHVLFMELYDVERILESQDFECSTDDLENHQQKFQSLTARLKMMEEKCAEGLYNSFCEEEEDDDGRDAVSSKVIGMSEVYEDLKEKVMGYRVVISMVGMPGIGKTTLAKKLLQDPAIVEGFDRCVWVRVGKRWGVKDIPRRILAEMDPGCLQTLTEGDDEAVNEYLKASLKSKRYLIVLDDVWDPYMAYMLDTIHRYVFYHIEHPFLHPESESRILLTSRLQQFGLFGSPLSTDYMITMRLLTEKESWDLFREKVFSGGPCPPQFEKAGKKISENCEGLPLTILTVARMLSEEKRSTLEYWDEVAKNEHHQLFKEAYEEMSKVLLPSYTRLPPLLQICFMYIGLFPQKYKIPRSKLINLWLVDGFDEELSKPYFDIYAIRYVLELASNNLVVVYQESISNDVFKVKTCGLHSSLWHLANKKARETKFALVLRSRDDGLGDGIKGQRRLSFHNNVLFSIKEVHQSVEDNCASCTRSLLCYGPYYQYQVPICFGLKLLRELDALLIRFYEFPMEVVQLVRLRYLALTLNGMIPASISELSNLQVFTVGQNLSIKSRKDPSYLPVEIWGMKELKHLQVMGSDLPDPCGTSLESLSTLLNVSAHSCTEAVFNAIPYLHTLGIRIELTPDDDGKTLSCLAHVSHLGRLAILKCVVINPAGVPPIVPLSSFLPITFLQKITLSGLGYPWKEISKIGSIPHLQGLKLKNYAFQGPEWNVDNGEFRALRFLVIEDTDLMSWKVGESALLSLRFLYIRHCYKLQKIPTDLRWIF